MKNSLYALLVLLNIFSDALAQEYSPEVIEKCSKIRKESCRGSCKDGERGKFTQCYIDPQYAGKMRWRDCYALHVGYSCPPCQELFSTNFGGSFKSISCEYFYTAIERKNKRCSNCLQLMNHMQVDLSDLN